MSIHVDDGAHVYSARGVANLHPPAPRELAANPEDVVKATAPAVEIKLSPAAQAALEGAKREKTSERAEIAVQGAKEVAAAAGVSQEQAVAAAQPTRSPPPAKGVVLFQATMSATKPGG